MPPRKMPKRTFRRPKTKLNATPGLIASVARKIIGKTNLELKHVQASINTTISNTAWVDSLNQVITVGTSDAGNRIGDKYKITSLRFAGSVTYADATNILRLIVFQWFSNTAPLASYILEDVSTTESQLYGSYNRDYLRGKRFRVLYDKLHYVDQTNKPVKMFKGYISGSKIAACQMIGGSAVTGDSNVYYLAVSDSGAIAHPAFKMVYMMDYTDL